MINNITDSDMIILQSVESYLKTMGTPNIQQPQEKLAVIQQTRDFLYSDIVRRIPRVASYLLSANLETDTIGQGLFIAISKHVMDPVFVTILMQYLYQNKNPEENGIVGALLAKIMDRYVKANWKDTTVKPMTVAKDKKDKVEPVEVKPVTNDMTPIKHLQDAISSLLGDITNIVCCRCGNLSNTEAMAIAACIAMNNTDTIPEIIGSDLPVTASLFDIVADPSNIIKSAMLLEKSAFPKLTTNQNTFVESLRQWVYNKLNIIPTQTSYQFLVAAYGSVRPADTNKYLIQIKDCGNQYSNLLTVAKQLINN